MFRIILFNFIIKHLTYICFPPFIELVSNDHLLFLSDFLIEFSATTKDYKFNFAFLILFSQVLFIIQIFSYQNEFFLI